MRTLLVAFGALLAFLAGRVLRVRRAHVVGSIERSGLRDAERIADGMYRSLGRGVAELLELLLRPKRSLGAEVDLSAASACVDALRRSGRGIVVATAHTGNWDLVACAAAERVPLTVITKHLSQRTLDRIWQGLRRGRGVRLLAAGHAATGATAALRRGELVAMLIDQAPERVRGTTIASFFGRPVRVDLSPALLAARARVPLITAFGRRRGDGRHELVVGQVFQPPEQDTRAWAERTMQLATAELERFVRQRPEQWLWLHRRWKDFEGGALPAPPRTVEVGP
ncbi:MAG TPA: lysophospholipid acyltransferase family protein [Polyangiaceae bacterium]|nr:lysophospholipid acyltransferase family protein [Polyangiaceae bacterium]